MTEKVETRRIVSGDGVGIIADFAGTVAAPAIVLMHGGGQTRGAWAGELDRLAQRGYRVVSYDARGHGDSDWADSGDYSLTALIADLEAVTLDVPGPIVLVGASMGGMTALHAVGQGFRANGLVLVDVVPRPDMTGVDKILSFMRGNPEGFESVDEAIDAVIAYNPLRTRPRNPAGMMRNLRRRADGRLYWHWDPMAVAPRNVDRTNDAEAAIAMARRVTIPTLLVRGGKSDVVSDDGVDELRQLIPQAEVFDVEAAGHMVAGDDNTTFSHGIEQFLQRHFPLIGTVKMDHS